MPKRSDRQTFVFVHAHPDDEAIFTAGTMAMLLQADHRVVLVIATGGELGVPEADGAPLDARRQLETQASCDEIGPVELYFLGYQDSGLKAENPDGFAHLPVGQVVDQLGELLDDLGPATAIIGYDDHGIYGHPDHVQVFNAVQLVAERSGIATVYESTVDREYLHFVETHVVVEAGLGGRPLGRGLAASDLGLPSVLIDTTINVADALEPKRRAMAAHASQLPADAPVFALGQANFAAVYGYEWYTRQGPATAIESLPQA